MAKITAVNNDKNTKVSYRVHFVKNGTSRLRIFKYYPEACRLFYYSELDSLSELTQEGFLKRQDFTVKKLFQFFLGYQYDRFELNQISEQTYKQVELRFNNLEEDFLNLISFRVSRKQIEKYVQENSIVWVRAAYALLNRHTENNFNPCPKIKKRVYRPPTIPSQSDINKLISLAVEPRAKMFLYLCIACGLRVSEIMALRWDRVDDNKIIIDHHTVNDKILRGHKSGHYRVINVCPQFSELCKSLDQDSVFLIYNQSNPKTFLTSKSFIANQIKKIYREAGVNCTIHDLRHYAISTWIKEGRDIIQVQHMAGHADVVTTLKIYGHLLNEPAPIVSRAWNW